MNDILIHALIPARGGSKTIPRKNIKIYRDLPLLVHSIKIAKKSSFISKVVVSTDDKEIQEIAIKHGAESPFLRPISISGDYATDFECFHHYISWLTFSKKKIPDVIVHLRPTYPERDIHILNKVISTFLKYRGEYDSLRTVIPSEKTPFKMYFIENNTLEPLFKEFRDMKEPYNQVRQILPKCYQHNGCIDIVNVKTITELRSMTGDKIYPYIMRLDDKHDIDTHADWKNSIKFGKKFIDCEKVQ